MSDIIKFAKIFAKSGFYVFPLYGDKLYKPYGWALNKVRMTDKIKENQIIPATTDVEIIEQWPELVKAGFNQDLTGYGVLGLGCVILDLDDKNGKEGSKLFKEEMQKAFNIPPPELVVKTKSGGFHLYYSKPKQLDSLVIKSLVNVNVGGVKYNGIDVRGDGGMVVGPTSDTWEPGVYAIVKGSPSTKLSALPSGLTVALGKNSHILSDPEVKPIERAEDEISILRRGEIPESLSVGNRNNGFYQYLCALRNKGIGKNTALAYAEKLVEVTEEKETLTDSVDIEEMIDRIWDIDIDNPHDVCIDLIKRGLYRLNGHRRQLTYMILETNPYVSSKSDHDKSSLRQLLARFAKSVLVDGKTKVINPADVVDVYITPDREVDTLGYMPNGDTTFTMAQNGTTHLNLWTDPRDLIVDGFYDEKYWDMFKELVRRIFGPEGSDEYKLGLDFPAWLIQRPGLKPVVTPFIMSRTRGAGKSLYLSILGFIFGSSKIGSMQAQMCRVEDIGSRFFNPSNATLLMFDEVQFPINRDMRTDAARFWKGLKLLITSEIIPVEYKGGNTVQAPNFAGIIMTANTGNNFPIEEFDRRIWIINNDPPELERGIMDEFFDLKSRTLDATTQLTVLNTLRTNLLRHQIHHKLDSMRAPMNAMKEEMYMNTLSDLEAMWHSYFSDTSNLLAKTPVLTESAIIYLISCMDGFTDKQRENPTTTFRDLRRRGLIESVKIPSDPYQTRTMSGIMDVGSNGAISETPRRKTLYTTRTHGTYNYSPNDDVRKAYMQNLHDLKSMSRSAKLADKFDNPEELLG